MNKYHFVGIGGIGMSGLARILSEGNVSVSGSDAEEGEMVQMLAKMGIPISIGHDPKNVPEGASVVYSSGISPHNPELLHANKYQLPILHRSLLLQQLMKDKTSLVVTGTHGKTTTSSLLASVCIDANLHPSYALGGVLKSSGTNGAKGEGPYFVAEGDESDGSFLRYRPFGAIITNIGLDHMDYYQEEEKLLQAFIEFGEGVSSKDHLFFCGSDERVKHCHFSGVNYGFHQGAKLKGSNFRQQGWKSIFDIEFESLSYLNVELALSGFHNALNGLAVFGMALRLGIDEKLIRKAFKNFKGVKRRCEFKGEKQQVGLIDDYGHHPTEIKATIKAIKQAAWDKRVSVLFQPHRYTRTQNCFTEFLHAFDDADEVIITDIYPAGEAPIPDVSAEKIVKAISSVPARYLAKEALLSTLCHEVRPFSLYVTLGAGDIWKIGEELLEKLKVKKIRLALIFGGKSKEHEISLKSALNIDRGLDRELFDIRYFYISPKGIWSQVKTIETSSIGNEECISSNVMKALNQCEVAFPVLHGPHGEDGTLQGLFEMLNLPYVGSNHQASALCMDKAMTKKIALSAGLRVAPFVDFSYYSWKMNQEVLLKKIQETLKFPLYVKPVHLGSTIGVKRVTTKEELVEAVGFAFTYDTHVLVEEEILGREIEFAVLGAQEVTVFPPGEILNNGTVYDYQAKYGENSFPTISKAVLSRELIDIGMDFAKDAYLSMGCDGFARVDCFLDDQQRYFLNEINPIPGFTKNSLYPKMCEANGLDLTSLLTKLVALALSRHALRLRYV